MNKNIIDHLFLKPSCQWSQTAENASHCRHGQVLYDKIQTKFWEEFKTCFTFLALVDIRLPFFSWNSSEDDVHLFQTFVLSLGNQTASRVTMNQCVPHPDGQLECLQRESSHSTNVDSRKHDKELPSQVGLHL